MSDVIIERRDLHPSASVPDDVLEAILIVGGTNPHGEPMYRLILAQDRVVYAAGAWHEWAGNIPADDRGGLGITQIQTMLSQFHSAIEAAIYNGVPRHQIEMMARSLSAEIDERLQSKMAEAPKCVIEEMRPIELYPFEGWILEKWKPAESFGSTADWESYRFNGMCALGEYPYLGDYELVAGPTPYQLSVKEVEEAIRQDYRQIQSRPRSARQRVALLMQQIEKRQQQKARDQRNKAEDFVKDGPIGNLRNRLSLGAGRVVQEAAKKAGLVGHFGN